MSGPALLHPWALGLLIALPGLHWLFRRADRKRTAAIRSFSLGDSADSTLRRGDRLRYTILVALGLVAIAVAQPDWRENQPSSARSGLDVVFLLDVSRSMLTRDGSQSRIEQARAAINDVVSHAADERLALVVFAGNASVECPLTSDYAFLRDQLKMASRDSVTLGGTRPGDAIRFAARTAFDDASRNARELVLLSDGGDEDSAPDKAAGELEKRGIRLVVAGAGDGNAPGFVPNSETDSTPIRYRGKPVIALSDSAGLRRVCNASAHCVYSSLPDVVFYKMVLDRRLQADGAGGASMTAPLLALIAAFLLAGERMIRRTAGLWRRRIR